MWRHSRLSHDDSFHILFHYFFIRLSQFCYLGRALMSLGMRSKAVQYLSRAYSVYEQFYGKQAVDYVIPMVVMGKVYYTLQSTVALSLKYYIAFFKVPYYPLQSTSGPSSKYQPFYCHHAD